MNHTKPKFTPGPWECSTAHVFRYDDHYDEVICRVDGAAQSPAFFSDVPGRAEANALLITQAPAMYEALKNIAVDLVGIVGNGLMTDREAQEIRAILRAVEGE